MKNSLQIFCASLLLFTLCNAGQVTKDLTFKEETQALEYTILSLVKSNNNLQALQEYGTFIYRLLAQKKIKRDEWYELQRLDDNLFLIAAFLGHTHVVRYLLQQGEYVDTKSYHGCTALYFAARARQTEVVKVLLAYGANMNISNGYSETPLKGALRLARNSEVSEILALFELYGADIQKKN